MTDKPVVWKVKVERMVADSSYCIIHVFASPAGSGDAEVHDHKMVRVKHDVDLLHVAEKHFKELDFRNMSRGPELATARLEDDSIVFRHAPKPTTYTTWRHESTPSLRPVVSTTKPPKQNRDKPHDGKALGKINRNDPGRERKCSVFWSWFWPLAFGGLVSSLVSYAASQYWEQLFK